MSTVFQVLTTWRPILGVALAGAGLVGALIVGLALGRAAWPMAGLAAALSLCVMTRHLHPPYRLGHWVGLILGSAGGMVAGLCLAVGINSQAHLQTTLEAVGFESALGKALERSQCDLAASLLVEDLGLLSQRPALSVPVRWQMWDRAAAHGCISGNDLKQARDLLNAHLKEAPLPPGVDRTALLHRFTPH